MKKIILDNRVGKKILVTVMMLFFHTTLPALAENPQAKETMFETITDLTKQNLTFSFFGIRSGRVRNPS